MTYIETVISSFTAKDLFAMYHFPASQKKYDKQFIQNFIQENELQSKVIQGLRRDPRKQKQKQEDKDMYSIASINAPYCFATRMMYRLFGYENTQKFSN